LGAKIFLGGKIFVLIICLKQFFLGTTQFGGEQKYLGERCPRKLQVAKDWFAEAVAETFLNVSMLNKRPHKSAFFTFLILLCTVYGFDIN